VIIEYTLSHAHDRPSGASPWLHSDSECASSQNFATDVVAPVPVVDDAPEVDDVSVVGDDVAGDVSVDDVAAMVSFTAVVLAVTVVLLVSVVAVVSVEGEDRSLPGLQERASRQVITPAFCNAVGMGRIFLIKRSSPVKTVGPRSP
jgi:hypothetical protein